MKNLSKKRVGCYIDGFNLYHSISALGPDFNYLKWVNLWSLSEAFIKKSQEELTAVHYFTALAYWLKWPQKRHKEFIKAISHFGVTPILGHFKEKQIKCNKCNTSWVTHEEKQSDVNIAAYTVHHAHLDMFDKALIISADSDLCHAIQLVIDTHTDKEINILVPPDRYEITRELRSLVPSYKIKQKHLKKNLLPDIIKDNLSGKTIATKPRKYNR